MRLLGSYCIPFKASKKLMTSSCHAENWCNFVKLITIIAWFNSTTYLDWFTCKIFLYSEAMLVHGKKGVWVKVILQSREGLTIFSSKLIIIRRKWQILELVIFRGFIRMRFTTGVQMSTSAQTAVYDVLFFFPFSGSWVLFQINDPLQALSIIWLRCLNGMNRWLTVQNLRGKQTGIGPVIEGKTLFSIKPR